MGCDDDESGTQYRPGRVLRVAAQPGLGTTITSAAPVRRIWNRPRRDDRICLRSWGQSNVTFLDPNDALCDENKCSVIINNQPVHSDQSHLSVYGAKPVVELLKTEIIQS